MKGAGLDYHSVLKSFPGKLRELRRQRAALVKQVAEIDRKVAGIQKAAVGLAEFFKAQGPSYRVFRKQLIAIAKAAGEAASKKKK